MLFNSLTFLFFFSLVLAVYYAPFPWKGKKVFLLFASYLFYAAWNPPFVLLIWISTYVDWFVARFLGKTEAPGRRRILLLLSLMTNLGLLGFFKYGGFFLENFIRLVGLLGVQFSPVDLGIILPVGISFYTFQTLSYTIDVYRGQMRPWPSFLDFALFVTFFPQLVAGPIVRAREFLPQLVRERRAKGHEFAWGLVLLTIGLFQKIVLADAWMAPVADGVFHNAQGASVISAWTGTLAFSAQIFFDFAGYSTCAIGIALTLGFALPDNFRAPYAAVGFSDFWRRWHISLSSWLRDYLYIPLGGNRRGVRRTYLNLILTMLLGGLWHGASWRFVAWGGLHGIYLAGERSLRGFGYLEDIRESRVVRLVLGALTYGMVLITWVFFRAQTFGDAWTLLQTMFRFGDAPAGFAGASSLLVALVTAGMLGGHAYLRHRTLEETWKSMGGVLQVCVLTAMLMLILVTPGADRAFIYFQF